MENTLYYGDNLDILRRVLKPTGSIYVHCDSRARI
jgi:hypothetical protein